MTLSLWMGTSLRRPHALYWRSRGTWDYFEGTGHELPFPKRVTLPIDELKLGIATDFVKGLGIDRNEIKEPFLSPCRLLARGFLHKIATSFKKEEHHEILDLTSASRAWNILAFRVSAVINQYLELNPVRPSTTNPFGQLVPILRQELVVSTLLATRKRYHDVLHYPRSIVAVKRLLTILRKACSETEGDLNIRLLARLQFNEEVLVDYQGRRPGE